MRSVSTSSTKASPKGTILDRLSDDVEPRLVEQRCSTLKTTSAEETLLIVSVNAITCRQSRSNAGVKTKPLPPRARRPRNQTLMVCTLDDAAVEPLYEHLLRAKKIQSIEPPARPE